MDQLFEWQDRSTIGQVASHYERSASQMFHVPTAPTQKWWRQSCTTTHCAPASLGPRVGVALVIPPDASADRALVVAIASGSVTALERLYDCHGRWMFSLARRIVGSQEDAEAVVHDVFTHVWREAGRPAEANAEVATWLGRLTRARALDRLRARPSWSEYAHATHDGSAARDVLHLAYFQGLSHAEIARLTGSPVETISTQIRSAIDTLRAPGTADLT